MENNVSLMAKHIIAQADMFDKYSSGLYEKCLAFLTKANRTINKVYITGCGDSYFAGVCVKDFFLKNTKVHTEAWHALELSRYVLPNEVDENSLVISISASGSVARTAECAIRAGELNAISVGITTNPESRLAKLAPNVLYIELEKNLGLAPGTQSYCASLLSLYCLATALGKINNSLTDEDVKEIFDYISKICEAMRLTANKDSDIIRKYVETVFYKDGSNINMYHVLGSGPNFGTAQFGVLKLLEAAGFDSLAQGIEEWAHSQYFTTKPSIHTIVIANKGQSHERAIEIQSAIKLMNGTSIIIGEENDTELISKADVYIPICGMDNIKEEYSGLIYCIPLELLAMHISDVVGHSGFQFEEKPWVKEENFKQIFNSRIVSLKETSYEKSR